MKNIPKHVAIIMDGNRRWAKEKGLPNIAGHRNGVKSIEKVLEAANGLGVEILTLYTFSTENWKRPKREVETLMKLLENYLNSEYKRLVENNIKLMTIGEIDRFPPGLRKRIDDVKKMTASNSGLTLNLALSYGSRSEIVRASKNIAEDVKNGSIKASEISEKMFSKYLYTSAIPDPDLLIRTGGEFRLSNFLLWQASYSEFYVTKKLWPDFGKNDFKAAVMAYSQRDRRIGG